ncbi:hypothetical protein MMC20_007892 [Loxospora ochrophaea]|nr:hypothetical protein [Loxospora ochrophaea]
MIAVLAFFTRQYHLHGFNLAGRSAYEPPNPEEIQRLNSRITDDEAPLQAEQHAEDSDPTNYVQQYDSRGRPKNRTSERKARSARLAQNDVLATIGVCVGVDADGKVVSTTPCNAASHAAELAKTELIMKENDFGLFLGVVDMGLVSVAAYFALGLRNRLQTFSTSSPLSLVDVVQIEWRRLGPLDFILAGLPASFTFTALIQAQKYTVKVLYEALMRRYVWPIKSRKRRNRILRITDIIEELMQQTSRLLLVPIQLLATSQRLGLVPAWYLPSPWFLVPFSSFSPIQLPTPPDHWTAGSFIAYTMSYLRSPVITWLLLNYVSNFVRLRIANYTRVAIARPDHPDPYSLKAATEQDLDDSSVPGLGDMRRVREDGNQKPTTILGVLKADIEEIVITAKRIRRSYTRWMRRWTKPNLTLKVLPIAPISNEERSIDPPSRVNSDQSPTPVPTLPRPGSSTNTTAFESIPTPGTSTFVPITPPPIPRRLSSSYSSPASSRPPSPPPPNPAVHVTTRTGSTSTLHMDVEVTGTGTRASFSASPRLPLNGQMGAQQGSLHRRHRVTALTGYPADTLSQHLISHIASLICMPLEALFVRSLALGFLAAAPATDPLTQASALALRSAVYPMGAWCGLWGGEGWYAAGRSYARKMLLCVGMESLVSYGVWEVGLGVAWWAGKKWYQWG